MERFTVNGSAGLVRLVRPEHVWRVPTTVISAMTGLVTSKLPGETFVAETLTPLASAMATLPEVALANMTVVASVSMSIPLVASALI